MRHFVNLAANSLKNIWDRYSLGMIYLFTPNQRNESYFEGAFTALFIKFAIFLASVKNILQDKS